MAGQAPRIDNIESKLPTYVKTIDDSTTITSSNSGQAVCVLNNVPAGTYQIFAGAWEFVQAPETNCHLQIRLNGTILKIGPSDYKIGLSNTGTLSGEGNILIHGMIGGLVFTATNTANTVDMIGTVSGVNRITRPFYHLIKIADPVIITNEWN